MGLLRRLLDSFQLTPSFAELRATIVAPVASYPRQRVVAELKAHAFVAPTDRPELERLLDSPLDPAAHARCQTLVGLERPNFARPGNVEELWYLYALLARLRKLDE